MSNHRIQSILHAEIKRRHWFMLAGVFVVVTSVLLVYRARFESYHFCATCALRQEVVAWQIPFAQSAVYQSAEVYSSPLSEVIVRHGLVDSHEHEWRFVFGSGNGMPMVFGRSPKVAAVMTSSRAGEFLEEVIRHSGPAEGTRWLASYRKSDEASWCRGIAESLNGQRFAAADDFRVWLVAALAERPIPSIVQQRIDDSNEYLGSAD